MENRNNIITQKLSDLKICVVMPTYNNSATLNDVIEDILNYTGSLIVVNDGSTDDTKSILDTFSQITQIEFKKNKGKGAALIAGLREAIKQGFEYAITIDSDGQHFASDIPAFVDATEKKPDSIIVGARNIQADGMPSKNTFANKFSNFWFKLETGISLPDTQSGFRLYPLEPIKNMRFFSDKYELEVEILVRFAWKDVPVTWIPVSVYYPPEEERVSHFRPFRDFSRISVLNTILVLVTLLWIWPRDLFRYFTKNKLTKVVKEQLVANNETPHKVASAVGFGLFMGILPVWGFQMLLAAFFAHLMKLNKVLVLVASNISIPPMIPFIVYFSYRTGGLFFNDGLNLLNKKSLDLLQQHIAQGDFYQIMEQLGLGIWQYVIGSIFLGFTVAATGWVTTRILSETYIRNRSGK